MKMIWLALVALIVSFVLSTAVAFAQTTTPTPTPTPRATVPSGAPTTGFGGLAR